MDFIQLLTQGVIMLSKIPYSYYIYGVFGFVIVALVVNVAITDLQLKTCRAEKIAYDSVLNAANEELIRKQNEAKEVIEVIKYKTKTRIIEIDKSAKEGYDGNKSECDNTINFMRSYF